MLGGVELRSSGAGRELGGQQADWDCSEFPSLSVK